MVNYGVKEIPEVVVKFRKDGEKNYKKLILDCLTEYALNLQGDYSTLRLTSALANDMFFDTFKPALVKNEIHDFKVSATNFRRNAESGEDEEYKELKDMEFDRCNLSYSLGTEGNPARFNFLFWNVTEGGYDE